jgi:hypothetical protein
MYRCHQCRLMVSFLSYQFSDCFLISFCVDTDASMHLLMPALITGTTVSDSNSSMGWNNTTWGQVELPNWPSLTSFWGVAQPQVDWWALSESPRTKYVCRLGWGAILSVCLIFYRLNFDFNLIFFLACSFYRFPLTPHYPGRDTL